MNVHFIAIGGAVMHMLAIALKRKSNIVTGSDDKIFDPARKNLAAEGILPAEEGFFPEKIHTGLDAVILGMHARNDNPELLKAQELGIPIYSFPEYIYEFAKNKKRVVIAGSHGKTTITSMLMHVLKHWKCDFDYMVGAAVKGFNGSVKLTEEAPVILLEGDEYLASPIQMESKFLFYRPHVALISGIAWDHINVFPDYKEYVNQFKRFTDTIEENGSLIYNTEDAEVRRIAQKASPTINKFPYHTPGYVIENNTTYLTRGDKQRIPLKIFGEHNLQNLQGARIVANELGISDDDFYEAIQSFEGAARRLELVNKGAETAIFKDFAHSPSKLKATVAAVKAQYPSRELVACMELHTFSSLSADFLKEYKNSMRDADTAIVYYNPATVALKKLAAISEAQITEAFNHKNLQIYTDSAKLQADLLAMQWPQRNLLMMSSGDFDGIVLKELADKVLYESLSSK